MKPYSSQVVSPKTAFSITPSDDSADNFKSTFMIWVGGAGDLSIVMHDGSEVVISSIGAGQLLPIRIVRVKTVGTTATSIIGFR